MGASRRWSVSRSTYYIVHHPYSKTRLSFAQSIPSKEKPTRLGAADIPELKVGDIGRAAPSRALVFPAPARDDPPEAAAPKFSLVREVHVRRQVPRCTGKTEMLPYLRIFAHGSCEKCRDVRYCGMEDGGAQGRLATAARGSQNSGRGSDRKDGFSMQ